MTVVKSEFLLALNQVATERNIPVEDVLSSIEQALVAAYKKEYPEVETSENDLCKDSIVSRVKPMYLRMKRTLRLLDWPNCRTNSETGYPPENS